MLSPGDVVLVNFPFHEQAEVALKKRPVLVVAVTGEGDDAAVWVMMITGNQRRFLRPCPTDIPIHDWEQVGLRMPSVLRMSRLWTAEQRDVAGTIGSVPRELLDRARGAVREAMADTPPPTPSP